MTVGRVVKFDEARGFGFIAPIGGNEDVFLHVNDLLIPESLVRPGIMLEFDIAEGERGLKASNICLPESDPKPITATRISSATAASPQIAAAPGRALATAPVAAAPAASGSAVLAAVAMPPAADADEHDLPTAGELSGRVTEMLLAVVPPLSSDQVLSIRSRMTELARDYGWLAS